MIAALLIVTGVAIIVLGIAAVVSSRDPLGYSPQGAYLIAPSGALVVAAGVLLLLLRNGGGA